MYESASYCYVIISARVAQDTKLSSSKHSPSSEKGDLARRPFIRWPALRARRAVLCFLMRYLYAFTPMNAMHAIPSL